MYLGSHVDIVAWKFSWDKVDRLQTKRPMSFN